jgi:hypothetical protein
VEPLPGIFPAKIRVMMIYDKNCVTNQRHHFNGLENTEALRPAAAYVKFDHSLGLGVGQTLRHWAVDFFRRFVVLRASTLFAIAVHCCKMNMVT